MNFLFNIYCNYCLICNTTRSCTAPFPFSDLSDEDRRLYNDVYFLLKDDFINYKGDLKHKDEPEKLFNSLDYSSGQDFGEKLESAISGQMEADVNGVRQLQAFSLTGDDLIVNKKKRNNIKDICDKGNSFGNWLAKLCNRTSS